MIEHHQVLNEKKTHLKEMLKVLILVLKIEIPMDNIKSIIACIELEKVSRSKSICRSVKPSNNANGCSCESIGVRVRKLLNIILKYDPNIAKGIKAMKRNKREKFISICVQCYIQENAELHS